MNWNYYINFIVLAIFGRTGEADTLLRTFNQDILDCAHSFPHPSPVPPLFRGVLLPPQFGNSLPHQPERRFLSFSQNLRVAQWFAHPHSIMSKPLTHTAPSLQGFIAQVKPPQHSVLFRPEWVPLIEQQINAPLSLCACIHPWVDADQFAWNLHTQQEFITTPIDPLPIQPLKDDVDVCSLDNEFCYPEFLCKDSSSSTSPRRHAPDRQPNA